MKGISQDKYNEEIHKYIDKYIRKVEDNGGLSNDDIMSLFSFYDKWFKMSEANLFFHLAKNGLLSYDDLLVAIEDNATSDVLELIEEWEDNKTPEEIVKGLYDIPLIDDHHIIDYLIHNFQFADEDDLISILNFMKNNMIKNIEE